MRRTVGLLVVFGCLFSACSFLKGKPAGMQVISNIPAHVSVEGKDVGITPFQSSDYQVKKYTVKVTPTDSSYTSHETSLKLFSGYVAQLDWNFGKSESESSGVSFEYDNARDKQKAELQLVASPDNVPVAVDGKNVGFTPLLLEDLSDGNHAVSFQAPGYDTFERTVKLIKGTRIMMTVKLAKLALPQPSLAPVATESAEVKTATVGGKKATSKPTAKPTPTSKTATGSATASPTPAASASGAIKKSTSTKPYIEVLTTPTGFLRIRQSPSASSTELFKLSEGSTVPYANASSSGWLKVTYDGTSTGWISGQYAKLVQ